MDGWDLWLILALLIPLSIVAAIIFDRAKARIRAHTRYIGTTLPYAATLIGRLPDGLVDDSISGVPIQLSLPFKEMYEYIRRVLEDTFNKMVESPEKDEFAKKILPLLEHNPIPLISYAFDEDTVVVQFNHVEGTLDQYQLGPSMKRLESVRQEGKLPHIFVAGALYPYPEKISIPGGLREAVVTRIPFLKRGGESPRDVDLFFFDPLDLSEDSLSIVNLTEPDRAKLAQWVQFAINYAESHNLFHENELLRMKLSSADKRIKDSNKVIKDQGREIRQLQTAAGTKRLPDPMTGFTQTSLTYILWHFGGLALAAVLAFMFGVGKTIDALSLGFLIVAVNIVSLVGGLMVNYIRIARQSK